MSIFALPNITKSHNVSGFEVASVVLGAIPLIISAIEHYESNLNRARAFWK